MAVPKTSTDILNLELIARAEGRLKEAFERIDAIALVNQMRVLSAFKEHKLTE